MKKKFILFVCGCFGLVLFAMAISFYRNYWLLNGSSSKPRPKPILIENDKNTEYVLGNLSYPNIESIFSDKHVWTATLSAEKVTKILVTGDILPARSVNAQVVSKNNPLWPYEKVLTFINNLNADITFVNLESPLIKNCPVTHFGMIFCGDIRNIEGLKALGTNIASLANNHTGNFGTKGFNETITNLKNSGIKIAGIGEPIYFENNGIKFAFLAFNDIEKNNIGMDLAEEDVIKSQLSTAGKNADIVIVMFHWGSEYRAQPDERQIQLAHYTIDHGADLIVSNHPHWIQPLEIYKEKIIMYAHGNFIFDQMWSEETRTGVLGLYTFYLKDLIDVEFFPIKIFDYGQAELLAGTDKLKVINEMKTRSYLLQSGR